MNRALFVVVLVAGLLTSGLGRAGNLRLQLEKLAQKLQDSQKAGSHEAVRRLPDWVPYGKARWLGPQGARVRPEALQILGAPRESARLKALAAFWWARYGSPDQLGALAELLDEGASSGRWPEVTFSQLMDQPAFVQWRDSSLGQIASLCLEKMTGRRFSSRRVFLRWQRMNAKWSESPDLQRAELSRLLSSNDIAGLRQRLASLSSKPELYARVLIFARLQGQPLWAVPSFPEKDRAVTQKIAQGLGAQGLLDLLTKKKVWPEFDKPEAYYQFRHWVLDRAEIVFGKAQARTLVRMARKGLGKGRVDARLIVAASRLNPKSGRDLLEKALNMSDQVFERTRVLDELVSRYLPASWSRVRSQFFTKLGADLAHVPHDIQTIIEALGARLDGRRYLQELAKNKAFPSIPAYDLHAFVRALRKRDPGFGCDRAGDLRLRFSKHYRGMQEGSVARKAQDDKIQSARSVCLERVDGWARQ